VFLDWLGGGLDDHSGSRPCRARGDRISRAFKFDHAQPAAAEWFEPWIVAKRWHSFLATGNDVVQRLTIRERNLTSVKGDGLWGGCCFGC
jgi:hypothetical protein